MGSEMGRGPDLGQWGSALSLLWLSSSSHGFLLQLLSWQDESLELLVTIFLIA